MVKTVLIYERIRRGIAANHGLILVISSAVVLFLLPFTYLFLRYREVPSLADFITELKGVGVSPAEIISGLFEGSFFLTGGLIVVVLFVGVSLVFDVSWRGKLILRTKSDLRLYFGYYLMIVILFSMFVDDLLRQGWHPRGWGTATAPALMYALSLLSLSIFLARIISKLPLKIGEANVGHFVMAIYLSYAFFKIMGKGFSLFELWNLMITVHDYRGVPELVPIYSNAFFILSLPAISASCLMILDRVVNKTLRKYCPE